MSITTVADVPGIVRQIVSPPAQLRNWIVSTVTTAGSLLGSGTAELEPNVGRRPATVVIVDRVLTRC